MLLLLLLAEQHQLLMGKVVDVVNLFLCSTDGLHACRRRRGLLHNFVTRTQIELKIHKNMSLPPVPPRSENIAGELFQFVLYVECVARGVMPINALLFELCSKRSCQASRQEVLLDRSAEVRDAAAVKVVTAGRRAVLPRVVQI